MESKTEDVISAFIRLHGVGPYTDPYQWEEVAKDLTKRESHMTAALAYTIAADMMRESDVPNIEKIKRWEMAASRQLQNEEAEAETVDA